MARYLIVEGNAVTNVILAEPDTAPEGAILDEWGAGPGWIWRDGVASQLVGAVLGPIVPETVAPYQARVALHRAGILVAAQAAIDAAGGEVQLAWEYATEVQRHSPFIDWAAAALELSAEQVDELFIVASQV